MRIRYYNKRELRLPFFYLTVRHGGWEGEMEGSDCIIVIASHAIGVMRSDLGFNKSDKSFNAELGRAAA